MEEALGRMSEERQLALLVSQATEYAIFMLDHQGFIRTWNPGAERMKGYRRDEIVGRHFSIFYTDEDRARDHPADELRIAAGAGRYEEEGWRIRKDGTRFWANVLITALHDENGALIGFGKVTRDLTERRRNEQALQKAVEDLRAANEELDRFASIAAHDMTDPLRTITGFAELLVDGAATAEEGAKYAQHILDSSLRLTAMLQALLAYARAGGAPAVSVPVAVADAVGQALDDLAGAIGDRDARVDVAVPEGARVAGDGRDLRIILQNLVSNALKFSDPDRPRVAIAAERDGECWRISVCDNGPGVASEDRTRIFAAFERVRGNAAGYGLGLGICQRLVERHGGRIGVDSAPGQGARFWFTLRAVDGRDDAASGRRGLTERA